MNCCRTNCTNVASVLPVMLFYADKLLYPGAPPIRAICSLPTCKDCKAKMTLADVLTDEGFDMFCGTVAAMGRVKPDRKATRLTFTRIDSDEAKDFLARTRTH